MYIPARNAEERPAVLHNFMDAHPFIVLVSQTDGELFATHLPVLLHRDRGTHGTIEGHFARANGHHRHLLARPDALCMFSGPNAYITPTWYPSKLLHGEAVPTWNYVAVHAHGTVILHSDHAFLSRHLEELTTRFEGTRERPWKVSDAPASYIAGLERAIVGFEMPIVRLEGKWKMSQNRPSADIDGVVRGLSAAGNPAQIEVAAIVDSVRPE